MRIQANRIFKTYYCVPGRVSLPFETNTNSSLTTQFWSSATTNNDESHF